MRARLVNRWARATACAAICIAVAFAMLPAGASTPEDAATRDSLRWTSTYVTRPGTAKPDQHSSFAAWVWHGGRRLYRLLTVSGSSGFDYIAAVDLDTGREVERVPFPKGIQGWGGDVQINYTRGQLHSMAVDQDTGRLFVAYQPTGSTADLSLRHMTDYASGRACHNQTGSTSSCIGGFVIMDGRTLEVLGTIPLPPQWLTDSAFPLVPMPRALAFVKPSDSGGEGKLLLTVEDHNVSATNGAKSEAGAGLYGRFELGRTYLMQFDIAARRLDWATQVDECRGMRDAASGGDGYNHSGARPGPGAVLRASDGAVWVGCSVDGNQSAGFVRIPIQPDGMPVGRFAGPEAPAPHVPVSDGELRPPNPATAEMRELILGPRKVLEFWTDHASGRVLNRVVVPEPLGEVWVVFDAERRRFIGSVGTGAHEVNSGYAGLDTVSGRFYVLHHDDGLYVADIRRNPLPQALRFPEFAYKPRPAAGRAEDHKSQGIPLVIDAGSAVAPRRVLTFLDPSRYQVIEDHLAVSEDGATDDFAGRTLNLDERDGVTSVAFDGAARGYGARLILQAGAEAAGRYRFADPIGWVRGAVDYGFNFTPAVETAARDADVYTGKDPCLDQDREVVLGFVGPSSPVVLDADGARGAAVPVRVDGSTASNLEAPISQCTHKDWDRLWGAALFGRPPASEPAAPSSLLPVEAECLQASDPTEGGAAQASGDPSHDPFAASVRCDEGEASGFSYVRGGVGPLNVLEAISSYRIYRDPGRGIVARVESIARGINIEGLVRIDSVRGVGESWANGRRQPVEAAVREPGYDPDCDLERSAGTCYQRHVFGVRSQVWSCGPCGDEQALLTGFQRIFQGDVLVRFRQPDEVLAGGAENGFTAAITKNLDERFADALLNSDLLQTVLPTLEIIRYASPSHVLPIGSDRSARPGRQIYQFAGVEVSSSYSIQCLLEYDPETNTCAAVNEAPGSLALELTSPDGKPLAGGAFELRADTDEDGVVGLVDTLVPEGACVTADDGVGTCKWDALAPGKYVVTQIAAPPGYSAVKEPYAVELVSGEARTVTFTNVSNVSTINVSAADEQDKPLQGATFAVYADPDADGKVAADAKPVAQCQTGSDGACTMSVPAGSYVLVQLGAPGGLEPIEPVAFALTAGGETAAVTVVNYPQDLPAPPSAAGQVEYLPPAPPPLPQLHAVPLPVAGIPMDGEPEIAGPGIGGTIVRVMQAPGDVLRLLARDPVQAAAFAATLLLLTLAWAGVQRRRQLLLLTGVLSG